jgi:DedD protein
MDQELKQRLIGAAVITALAAIFVPMLFDDPIDETGKSINTLKIPELPAKVQDVEIAPLPEKAEDVATELPAEGSPKSLPKVVDESVAEMDVETPAPHPKLRLTGKETAIAVKHAKPNEQEPAVVLADDEQPVAEAEDIKPVLKPQKAPVQSLPIQATPSISAPVASSAKAIKPPLKPSESVIAENPGKQVANEQGIRWYLNAGSFGQKANAVTLQDNLKQQGFSATIKEVSSEKGTVYKVRVGPMLDKLKAQAVKNKLSQININSFVSPDE